MISHKVSIVVAYNTQVEMTKQFLETMWNTLSMDYNIEFILINGGNEVTLEHPVVTKTVVLESNEGFSKVINSGLKEVSPDSDYIFLVGNDSFPLEFGWLEQLISLQEETGAWVTCPANDRPGMEAYKHLYIEDKGHYWTANFFPSIAYLLTKECFDKIGLWDERFTGTGMYGDNDYCKRVINEGGSIVVSKNILLRHLLSQESSKCFNVQHDMNVNGAKYNDKWG